MAKPSDFVELRVDIPAELAQQIDALMIVDTLKSRADYVVPILEKAVRYEIHRATLLCRMAKINPLDATKTGRRAGD